MHTRLCWDWKDSPGLADLRRALEPLGVRVYEDPRWVGSDQFGYVFSSEPLTAEQLKALGPGED